MKKKVALQEHDGTRQNDANLNELLFLPAEMKKSVTRADMRKKGVA